jgi:hypothetical protein
VLRVFTLALVLTLSLPHNGSAQTASLEGSWNGGGFLVFASGAKEQARCRVHYTRRTDASYFAKASCATASGRAAQTAILRRASQNSYRGRFHNSEYNISGIVHVILHGNSQSVRLTSQSASAFIQLTR